MNKDNKYYTINVDLDEDMDISSLITNIDSLKKPKKNIIEEDDKPVIITKPKKKKKKKTKSILNGAFDIYIDEDKVEDKEEDDIILLDAEDIIKDLNDDNNENIINEQKKGYKKLKKQEDVYKKEFAEEITLLYTLLDDTSKFEKELEKKYKLIDGQKVRGISKYTNDLAQIVLNAKQNKLGILKEISAIKKTIADLNYKVNSKNKTNEEDSKNPEHLASAYFKSIMNHGRNDFIKQITPNDDSESLSDIVDNIDDELEKRLMEANGIRSNDANKYIEYENRGVKLYVNKCIDTGEWTIIAIDKYKEVIDDYPVPTKRETGRMKFSADGTYATDEKGRMYKVLEYYLDDEDE